MAELPEAVRELLKKGANVWVATTSRDGEPNVSVKGCALLDNENLYFADMYSKKTLENLIYDNRVAVGILSDEDRIAIQVKGVVTLLDEGELFDRVKKHMDGLKRNLPPVKYVVRIRVDSVWDMSASPSSGERLS